MCNPQFLAEEASRQKEKDKSKLEGWNEAIEAAAEIAKNACLVPPDGGSPTEEEVAVCDEARRQILSLKKGQTDD